jgi:hypothetical protein
MRGLCALYSGTVILEKLNLGGTVDCALSEDVKKERHRL